MRVIIDLLKSILDKVKTISEGSGGGGYDFIFRFEDSDGGFAVVPEKGDLDTATALCESGKAPKVLAYGVYNNGELEQMTCFLTLSAFCERSDEGEGFGDASIVCLIATGITSDTLPDTDTPFLMPTGLGEISWVAGQDSPTYNPWV